MKVKDHVFKEETLERRIEQLDAKAVAKRCRVAFSGLPSDIAKDIETSLSEEGVAVFSNAASHRMRPDVPLLIPEVNPDHLDLIKKQKCYKDGGYIVTNANCSTTGLALPLKAILEAFGLKFVCVSTYQAISGAGYPGVPSLDIMANIVPFIKNEEEKMEEEIFKMLGKKTAKGIEMPKFDMVASCARVPVIDGHTESVVIKMDKEASVDEVVKVLTKFRPAPQRLGLPTAPLRPIIVRMEENRPQPLCDVYAGEPSRARGMAVTVGRVRQSGNKYTKLWLLSHNTLRGGAGGSVLNAELARAKKLL